MHKDSTQHSPFPPSLGELSVESWPVAIGVVDLPPKIGALVDPPKFLVIQPELNLGGLPDLLLIQSSFPSGRPLPTCVSGIMGGPQGLVLSLAAIAFGERVGTLLQNPNLIMGVSPTKVLPHARPGGGPTKASRDRALDLGLVAGCAWRRLEPPRLITTGSIGGPRIMQLMHLSWRRISMMGPLMMMRVSRPPLSFQMIWNHWQQW